MSVRPDPRAEIRAPRGGPARPPVFTPPVPTEPEPGRAGDGPPLTADFYARPVLEVARELIGCVVEHGGASGAIVETEAYHESEPACHAFVGVTPRTRTLFAEPGTAYVYRSYGIHALLNAVCEPAGVGAAVLIRALEPLSGVDRMRARRGGVGDEQLCSGPGKLTQALGVELSENGTSLLTGPVIIRAAGVERVAGAVGVEGVEGVAGVEGAARGEGVESVESAAGVEGATPLRVLSGTRIGISRAVELRWRFCAAGNRHVSRPRPAGFTDRSRLIASRERFV